MSDAVMKLLPQVQALSDEEWFDLCDLRYQSEPGDLTPEEADAAWLPVLERRREELRSGKVKGVTMDELFASLNAQRAARKAARE